MPERVLALVRRILPGKCAHDALDLFWVCDLPGAAEDNDAAVLGGELFGDHLVPVNDAEAHLVAGADRVQLVPRT